MHPLNQLLTHPKDKASALTWTKEALSVFSTMVAASADVTQRTKVQQHIITPLVAFPHASAQFN